ncbi:glutamine-hydrolyzing carbamoyl-phosphate synthase small subunit [Conexibacter sp. DBS9H8]|uniref:glutamine-hydrolyzing carbamoyl-phosphate synthase small subunit n=1 Tax=Conexibacter sp. DBS9H8 TaxID=2937801 RepID=UPI002010BB6B|nr:glutamine-hydrolyzing carbamoyl-phosphate synthase small subunit [Conexibacter sp. DBS9H8]
MSGAYVLLADGARFDGESCGAERPAVGEIVFTTSMSGYQETVTDPSYAGQLVTFTAPQIGNYGVSPTAMESDSVHARAVIMRAGVNQPDILGQEPGWLDWLTGHDIPAITDLDTRALVRHIREAGAMAGGVFPASVDEAHARRLIAAEPPMAGRDLTHDVSPATPLRVSAETGGGQGVRIAMIDTGVKASIVRELTRRGAEVTRHPRGVTAAELLDTDADAFFLANGPGDPAALADIVDTVRGLIGRRPVYGICLGHQLLCRAIGLETYKLTFGHHGANHPVRDLTTGRTEITAQNHGFAVLGPDGARTVDVDEPVRWETDFGAAELTHINLYDRTVEGLRLLEVPAATVQYHPEAGPGPNDSLYLFDRFIAEIRSRQSTPEPPESITA